MSNSYDIHAIVDAFYQTPAPFSFTELMPENLVEICAGEFINGRIYDTISAGKYFLWRYINCMCYALQACIKVERLLRDNKLNSVGFNELLSRLVRAESYI